MKIKKLNTQFVAFLVVVLTLIAWWDAPGPSLKAPPPTTPSFNAYDTFTSAANLVRDDNIIDSPQTTQDFKVYGSRQNDRLSGITEAQIAQVTKDNTPALACLRQGFGEQYQCPPEGLLVAGTSHIDGDWKLATLLRLEARAAATRGDWADAAEGNVETMRFAMKIASGSTTAGGAHGYGLATMGRRDLWSVVGHLDRTDSAKLATDIQLIQQQRTPLANNVQQDRWQSQMELIEFYKLRLSTPLTHFLSFGNIKSPWSGETIGQHLYCIVAPKSAFLDQNVRYFDTLTSIAHKPYSEVSRLSYPSISDQPYFAWEFLRFEGPTISGNYGRCLRPTLDDHHCFKRVQVRS